MTGITIGVFSVISVMTAIGALQNSIESGISFLGSNIFQFAKVSGQREAGRARRRKNIENRHNITYLQAPAIAELMEGSARRFALRCFGRDLKGQAVYKGVKTTPSLTSAGRTSSFLTANTYSLGYGRNI